MHLLKFDPKARTLEEVKCCSFGSDTTCHYFSVESGRVEVPVMTTKGIAYVAWQSPERNPDMTDQHRATPEQWAAVEEWGEAQQYDAWNCILELRARVEALEAAQRLRFIEIVTSDGGDEEREPSPPAPADSLVERVINAIAYEHDISPSWKKEARAAIREVAAWMDERHDPPTAEDAVRWLRDEANR